MKYRRLINCAVPFGFFLLLSFPLFYFSYKFSNPEPLAHDFFQYYRLYKDWDIDNVNAPFNMRLVGSFLVHLLYDAGMGYDTATAFDYWTQFGFEKRVFFCAVFFNYLCVVATASVIYMVVNRATQDGFISVCAGLVFLLSFGTLFYALMPLTDAFSVLLFAVVLWFYQKRHLIVFFLLAVSVFQREYILLTFALIGAVDAMFQRDRFAMMTSVCAIACFVIFFVLRRTFFHTPALAFQTSFSHLWHSLWHAGFRPAEYIRSLALSLNIFWLYLAVVVWKRINGHHIDRKALLLQVLLLLQIIVVSFAALLGNNTGRYYYIASPLLIFHLACEVRPLFRRAALFPET